jgi:hypothetical protein
MKMRTYTIASCIYYLRPRMEMKGREFSKVGLVHVDVKTLALVNVSSSISSHVNE